MDLSTKIFKVDVPTLKGNSVRLYPPVVKNNDIIEIPSELKTKGMKVDLDIDVVFINNECFLHMVDRRIKFKGLSVKGNATTKNYSSRFWITYFGIAIKVVYK